ncbi:MAG: putative ABC transporter permease [Lachnospiraceae bacterium]|nr:putative ABC transporter permease [Lachnospiraceae bacterium]
MTLYRIAASFVIYSMLGWLVESIYMSICEKKIVNRGFARGPFCPIYGFGATIGCIVLAPLREHFLLLYLVGAVFATIFEYLVGRFMIRALGSLWWDYDDKPFNFQGIICLESTLAWGFYAIGVVAFINVWLMNFVDSLDPVYMTRFIEVILAIAVVDYVIRLVEIFKAPLLRARDTAMEVYRNLRGRWS